MLVQFTEKTLQQGASSNGAWSKKQFLALDVAWDSSHKTPFKGWKEKLIGSWRKIQTSVIQSKARKSQNKEKSCER
jgi:hypothetical protein